MGFAAWVDDFENAALRRRATGDPNWDSGARLPAAVVRSVQRFQVGEDGDGANLITKSDGAGDAGYTTAVRMFVAEEQNHARMLALLLAAAGTPTISGHWSDTVFVRLRCALGLRLELMVLMVAEVIALRYYRALRDGTDDALTADVAGRILADEERHVPFHCQRLRDAFSPGPLRTVAYGLWWFLMAGVAVAVAVDHGSALRRLGVDRRAFVRDVLVLFRSAVEEVSRPARVS